MPVNLFKVNIAVVVASFFALQSPALAQQPPGGGGGPATTLSSLGCGPTEIARVNGADEWECSADLTANEAAAAIAQTTADAAVNAAAAAQVTADGAEARAIDARGVGQNAQLTADGAQATANQAVSDAAAAQSTAFGALTIGRNAQTTANSARAVAADAQSRVGTLEGQGLDPRLTSVENDVSVNQADLLDLDDRVATLEGATAGTHKIIFTSTSLFRPVGEVGLVTTIPNDANLGDLDRHCMRDVWAFGLQGTYRAWASSDRFSAASRMTHANVPYVDTNGRQIADDWADLTDGDLDNPINTNAAGGGGGLINFEVWTGTNSDGTTAVGLTCDNWSDSFASGLRGMAGLTDSGWTDSNIRSCNAPGTGSNAGPFLICVQQ